MTDDLDEFQSYTGVKINYSKAKLDDCIQVNPSGLLERDDLEPVDYRFIKYREKPVMTFTQTDTDLPYDVLSAIFFMVSRYEEYQNFKPDQHGRFPLKSHVSHQNGFYHKAIVHHWMDDLIQIIKEKYQSFEFQTNQYKHLVTIDVDNAFAVKHKGVLRTSAALLKSLFTGGLSFKQRLDILRDKTKDPYDQFDFLQTELSEQSTEAITFFLSGEYGKYDKNIPATGEAFKQVVSKCQEFASIGLHPSYRSNADKEILQNELNQLNGASGKEITSSRQHFLKLHLPDSYLKLQDIGITDDYTMGFVEEAGFRLGCAVSIPFFDLKSNTGTELMLHPFQFMDATYSFYRDESFDQMKEKLSWLIEEIKSVNGTFISVWHNESFGYVNGEDWKSLFTWHLEQAKA